MKNFTTIRLRLWVPIFVFGAFSLLLLFFSVQEHHQYELNIEKRMLTSLKELLARTGPMFENFLKNDMDSFVETEVANLSIPTEVKSVVFVDDQGVVLYGSQMKWRGHPVHDALPLFDRNHFLSAQENRRPDIHLSPDRKDIVAYQPVVFTVKSGQIRSSRVGMIFINYDLSRSKARIFHTLVVRSLSVWAVGLFLMLSLWAALNRWLTQPLSHLKERVNLFSQGEYQVRAEVTGHGELTELSQAFNAMADEVLRNSTERRKSEEALRDKENRYRTLLDQATDAIFVCDMNTHLVDVNREACEGLGYTREELLTLDLCDVDPTFETEQHAKHVWRELSPGKSLTIESRHRRKDGSDFPVEIHIGMLEISGQPAVLGIARNINERKQIEAELSIERSHIQSLFEVNGSGMLVVSSTRQILQVNNQFCNLFGYSHDELVGQSARILHIDQQHYEDWAPRFQEAKIGRPFANADYPWRRKDGTIFWCFFSGVKMQLPNGEDGVLWNVIDITERKRGEEERRRLVTAIEQSVDSIIITDQKGIIQYVNPGFEQSSGYTKDEVIGKTPRILQSGKHDALFYKEMRKSLISGKAWRGHLINKKKDGTLFEEESSITPVLNEAGRIINYVAVKRDVTGQIQLEEQLRQTQKMEAIGTLAGGIAHDFNNILAPILGYSELALSRIPPGDPLTIDLQQVIIAASRAKDLVQQILAFSRQAAQERKPLQPHLVVKEVLKLLRASLPTTIEIREEIAADCGTILADPTQLHQIIMNLCTNAYHAMRESGGILGVRVTKTTIKDDGSVPSAEFAPGDYVLIEVSDTGYGMDQKTLAHIFDPYFTTKKKGEGTGLGLSVVHGIVKSYQGNITVDSQPGQGTCFHVYLPRITEVLSGSETVCSIPITTGTERLLVVDDEEVITTMLEAILSNLGYQITVVNSSEEALALFTHSPWSFDLLITDMTMPHMTGLELAQKTMAIRSDLPIILCTGFSDLINKEQARALGIRAYLMKPVSVHELARAVRLALDKQ